MLNIDQIAGALLSVGPHGPAPISGGRSTDRIEAGSYRVEYELEPDQIFLVRVRAVPRVLLYRDAPTHVGDIAGVPVDLVSVVGTDRLDIQVQGRDCATRETLDADFEGKFADWAQSPAPRVDPPQMPGVALMELSIVLSDDVGTTYHPRGGEAAGSASPWTAVRHFEPAPPPTANLLVLVFAPSSGLSVTVSLPLLTGSRSGATDSQQSSDNGTDDQRN